MKRADTKAIIKKWLKSEFGAVDLLMWHIVAG